MGVPYCFCCGGGGDWCECQKDPGRKQEEEQPKITTIIDCFQTQQTL
jgi:hypothetical protein